MKEGNQNNAKLIWGFFRRILDKEETKALRQKWEDTSFQERLSEEAVRQYGRVELKEKLENIHEIVQTEQRSRRIFLTLIFATFLAILALVCWYFVFEPLSATTTSPDQIFANYFTPYPNLFEQKGETSAKQLEFTAAMEAYAEQDYANAIRVFEQQLGQGDDGNSLFSFYYAIALLADRQSGQALRALQALQANSNTLLPKEPLRWYLALAYLAENRATEAGPLLKELASQEPNRYKQREAEEVLKLLTAF